MQTVGIDCVGRDALVRHGPALDRLAAQTELPVFAQRPALQVWADAYPDWEPWVVGVERDGELVAAIALARQRFAGAFRIVNMGGSETTECPASAVSDQAAADLADELARRLAGLRRPWVLHLNRFAHDDPLASRLAGALPTADAYDVPERPEIDFSSGLDANRYLSRNLRNAEAKARNRIARAGLAMHCWVEADPDALARWMPEVMRVHRERDLHLRGESLLDDDGHARFYRGVVTATADATRAVLLTIDGDLAAYAWCIVDRGVLRVYDNRVAPKWHRYSAGVIANNAAVRWAAAELGVHTLDWGGGPQRYKLSSCNRLVPARNLSAWSSRRVRALLGLRAAMARRPAQNERR